MKNFKQINSSSLPDYIDAFIYEKQMDINQHLECKISDLPHESTLILKWKPTFKVQYNQQFLCTSRKKTPSKRKRNFDRANTWKQDRLDSIRSKDTANTWSSGHKDTHTATDVFTPVPLQDKKLDTYLATPDSGCHASPPIVTTHNAFDNTSDYYEHQIVEPEFVCEQLSEISSYTTKSCCCTAVTGDTNYAYAINTTVPVECTSVTITDPVSLKCDSKIVNQNNCINKNSILFLDEDLCLNILFDKCEILDFNFDRVTLAEGPRHKKLRASYGPIIVYMNLLKNNDKYAVSPDIHYQESDYQYHWRYHNFEPDISKRAFKFNSVKHYVLEMKDIMKKYLEEHNLNFPK